LSAALSGLRTRLFFLGLLATLSVFNHLQNGMLAIAALVVGFRIPLLRRGARRAGWFLLLGLAVGAVPYCGMVAWETWRGMYGDSWVGWFIGGGGFESIMFNYSNPLAILWNLWSLLMWQFPSLFFIPLFLGVVFSLCGRIRIGKPIQHFCWIVIIGNTLFFAGYSTWDQFSFFLTPFVGLAVIASLALIELERAHSIKTETQRTQSAHFMRLTQRIINVFLFFLLCVKRAKHALCALCVKNLNDKIDFRESPIYYLILFLLAVNLIITPYIYLSSSRYAPGYETRYHLNAAIKDPIRKDSGTIDHFLRTALAALPPNAVWVDDGSTYYQAQWLQQREGIRPDIRLEHIATTLMQNVGTDAKTLALRKQWRESDTPWFLVADNPATAPFTATLAPFGWKLHPFTVGDGLSIFVLQKGEMINGK